VKICSKKLSILLPRRYGNPMPAVEDLEAWNDINK